MRDLICLSALLAALACCPASAQAPKTESVRVYSNVCFEAESGDAAGYRITLKRSAGKDQLTFEFSEGPLTLWRAHDVKLANGTLDFVVTDPDTAAHTNGPFHGTITDDTISGVWSFGAQKTHMDLRRTDDRSDHFPPCPPARAGK